MSSLRARRGSLLWVIVIGLVAVVLGGLAAMLGGLAAMPLLRGDNPGTDRPGPLGPA